MPTERATPVEIDLPVYTGIFKLQRRLYRVYDVELPMPVSFPQAAAFLVVAAAVYVALRAVGVDLSPGSAWAFLVPPGVAAWLANRPVADQRSPLQWAGAQLRYALEPRAVTGLAPSRTPRSARFSVKVWERHARPAKPPKPPKEPKVKAPKPPKQPKAKAPKPPKESRRNKQRKERPIASSSESNGRSRRSPAHARGRKKAGEEVSP